MGETDLEYFSLRYEQEREMVVASASREVALVHQTLARIYAMRIMRLRRGPARLHLISPDERPEGTTLPR